MHTSSPLFPRSIPLPQRSSYTGGGSVCLAVRCGTVKRRTSPHSSHNCWTSLTCWSESVHHVLCPPTYRLSVPLSVCLSVCPSVCLSIHLLNSICLFRDVCSHHLIHHCCQPTCRSSQYTFSFSVCQSVCLCLPLSVCYLIQHHCPHILPTGLHCTHSSTPDRGPLA